MKKKHIKTWESKQEFKEEVYVCAHKLEVSVKHIAMRAMTSKWASCSTSGYFTFNTDLLSMDRKLGRYVILHELMHFHVPNHETLEKFDVGAHARL